MIGHAWAVAQLRQSLRNRRARHAYLLVGPESVGKRTLAQHFAMALNCLHADEGARPCGECSSCQRIMSGNHADMVWSQTDAVSGALRIEEIRATTAKLALRPYEGRCRIAILDAFDRAAPIAQDALLKTLEEPAPQAVLLLLAESADRVLPTITSRAQTLSLRPVAAPEIARALRERYQAEAELARLLAQACGGRPGWASRALSEPALLEARAQALDSLQALLGQNRAGRFAAAEALAKDKQALLGQLQLWQSFWRDVLLANEATGLPPANPDRAEYSAALAAHLTPEAALKALQATRSGITTISTTNASPRMALEVMLLDYPGL